MINEQLMEKVGKDLESIVAGDRKARETLDQVKQVAGMGRTIHYNVKIVICAAALVGLYCLWNVFFRYEDFTIYWIVAIYAYICFVTSLPRLFRMQFRIPDQYELMHLNTLLHQNASMYMSGKGLRKRRIRKRASRNCGTCQKEEPGSAFP